MLEAIKKFFRIQENTAWVQDRYKLADVPVGAKIIDNGGITEGWAPVEWTKNSDGTWSDGSTVVNTDYYFTMPFLVVEKPLVEVS